MAGNNNFKIKKFCSAKPLPHKLKQKPNQSLRYDTASALRINLTSDMRECKNQDWGLASSLF